ncbi:MAG: hypothetical protein IT305_29955 [Chloroflexi bacterium]|nr:hypothetical protein [Chloroflexota bacterium]
MSMDTWINDVGYTTGMVVFGAVISLVLSVLATMIILGQSWPRIRKEVVDKNSASYGILTGALFASVCALVGVANRQSITPIWDPTFSDRVAFMLAWVLYGQIVSFVLLYIINWLLFGLTPTRVREELILDHNTSVAAVSGLTYLGVSLLVVFRIF